MQNKIYTPVNLVEGARNQSEVIKKTQKISQENSTKVYFQSSNFPSLMAIEV